jgi:hypothetical protein
VSLREARVRNARKGPVAPILPRYCGDDGSRHPRGDADLPQYRRAQKRVSLIRCLLLACLVFSSGAAWAANPVSLDLAMKLLPAPQPPHVIDDTLILSFRPEGQTRFVGVRFASEGWAILHPCEVNENGVFVLDWPIPEGLREIRYRVVVDGQGMADPLNADFDTDVNGTQFSVFTLEGDPVRPVVNPKKQSDGTLTFVYRGAPGKRVAIVGDFNNWDPFMDSLSEDAPGSYSVTIRVPPGRHWYYFLTDGRRVLDIYNTASALDPDGAPVNTFTNPS